MVPEILRQRPLMVWAVIFMLIPLGALIVPLDWATTGQTTFINADQSQLDAFAPRIDRLDRRLQRGQPVTVTRAQLDRFRPYLQARRLTRAGSMSQDEVIRAVDLLRRRNRRIARESRPASKRSVRSFWADRLAETFPHLERRRIPSVLGQLERQIERHVHLTHAPSNSDPRDD